MTDYGENFVAGRTQGDHNEGTQESLRCHLCSIQIEFRSELEFLEHLRTGDHLGSAIDAPDGPIFKSAVRKAASKA